MHVDNTATFGLVMVMILVLLMQQVRTELALKLTISVSPAFTTFGTKLFSTKAIGFVAYESAENSD
jgi:hypothetical protein